MKPATNPFLTLDLLLLFVPAAIGVHYFAPQQQVLLFALTCLAIIPLAGWLGRATEHLAAETSESIGGLLNATFGNAAELIIAIVALQSGLSEVVKASLTGSIIGNILLVLGASFLAGGLKHRVQTFNATGARTLSTMLMLSVVALVMPATVHHLAGADYIKMERNLSLDISIVLIATYALSLLFSLKTHRDMFSGESHDDLDSVESHWSARRSVSVLLGSTALIAWMSELLVGSVEHAAVALGMNSVFVGVIVVALVGNAAEHSSAIAFAIKNRMELVVGIAIGSSVQIAAFVAPVLVLASYVISPTPMDLVFTPLEIFAIGFSVLIASHISADGESNWLEGAQLISVYVIVGLAFYFMPA